MSSAHTHDMPEQRSNWARILRTSLRDATRLRFDVEQRIEQVILSAQLESPLAQIVRRITNDSRLLYSERIAVAEELAAHFADGVDAGESPEKLAKDFGDDAQASHLISRSQRRKRKGPGRYISTSGKVAGILLLVILAIYGVLAVRFFFGSPDPSHDYLADLNKPVVTAPAEERAWPVYREALLMLEAPPMIYSARTPVPGEPGWDQLADYLRQMQPAIERFSQGAAKPTMGYTYNYGVNPEDADVFPGMELASEIDAGDEPLTLINVLLPHTTLRQVAVMVGDDIRRAVADDDLDAATRNFETMLGMATQMLDGPTLIEQLVGYSIANIATERFGEIALDAHWSSQQLARIDDAFRRYGDGQRIITNVAGERHMFMDVIQHTYTDDGTGDGRLTWSGLEMIDSFMVNMNNPPDGDEWLDNVVTNAMLPAMTVVSASRQEVVDKYDEILAELIAEGQQPHWQRDSQVDMKIEKMAAESRWEFYPITVLMPAISKVFTSADRSTMQRDATRVAIAALQYRMQHGNWPATLDAMIPANLDAAPIDQYTGKPLGYAVRDGQPVVYSVGNDGDDDGGRPAEAQDDARMPPGTGRWQGVEEVDGDWILWPRNTAPDDLEYDADRAIRSYTFQRFVAEEPPAETDAAPADSNA